MRPLLSYGLACFSAIVGVAVWACGGDDNSSSSGDDASTSDVSMVNPDQGLPDVSTPPLDAQTHNCDLGMINGNSDPVLLCSQETALQYTIQFAYKTGAGVAHGFDTQSPYGPTSTHVAQDDLALVDSIGAYHCSAGYYGNSIYTGAWDKDLADLATTLMGEMGSLTQGYDGETYFQLRNAAQAFYQVNDQTNGAAMNAAALAFAQQIVSSSVRTVSAPLPPAPAVDGGAAEAGPSDAGAGEGGSVGDGGTGTGGTITAQLVGTLNGDGTVTYSPAKSAMAAAALLDEAALLAIAPDAGVDASTWQGIAASTLAYLWARGRDPVTGLFYESVTTSMATTGDTPAGTTYTADALLTDVQGTVVLGFSRALAATNALAANTVDASADAGSPVAAYKLQIEALVTAMTGAGLFDGQTTMPTGATGAPPGAFMEGLIPSTGVKLTNMTTLGNARLMGGYARAKSLGVPTAWSWELAGIRAAVAFGPTLLPHTNMVSVVTGAQNSIAQLSYLTAVSQAWDFAPGFSAGGTDGGLAPGAKTYDTAAMNAIIEGLSQYWYESPNMTPCVY